MIAVERETHVSTTDADQLVYITTSRRRDMGALLRDDRVAIRRTWRNPDTGAVEQIEATVPRDQWSPLGGLKRRRKPLTDAQLEALGKGRSFGAKNAPLDGDIGGGGFGQEVLDNSSADLAQIAYLAVPA